MDCCCTPHSIHSAPAALDLPAEMGTDPKSDYIFRIRVEFSGKVGSGFGMHGMVYIECKFMCVNNCKWINNS